MLLSELLQSNMKVTMRDGVSRRHKRSVDGGGTSSTERKPETGADWKLQLKQGLRGLSYADQMARISPRLGASRSPGATSVQLSQDKDQVNDQTTIQVQASGSRKTYVPSQPNGKTLYFFFGLKDTEKDRGFLDTMDEHVEDDVASAVTQGFTVCYDQAGTKADFLAAVYDQTCYGIYWCGHGFMDGDIQTSDGSWISPSDIDKTMTSGNIQYLILAACGSGLAQEQWQEVMGSQCRFQGWVKKVNLSQVNDFTSDGGMLDGVFGHKGTTPSMELDDYIDVAQDAE